MRQILVAGTLLLVGCQGTVGPLERRTQPPVLVNDPRLTIPEQEQLKREEIALPQKSYEVGPRTYAEEPSYRGP